MSTLHHHSSLFDRVLCAVETHQRSDVALYNAVAFTSPQGALHVLTVASDHSQVPTAQKALDELVARTIPQELSYRPNVDARVEVGIPKNEILHAIERLKPDLVVLCTRGHGRLHEAVVGSTSHDVLRRSPVPVMVIPPSGTELVSLMPTGPVFHVGGIIVPVDPRRIDGNHLRAAARIRHALSRVELLLLYVQCPGESVVEAGELRDVAARHSLPKGTAVEVVSARSVHQGIAAVALRDGAGLIVMGLADRRRMEPGRISHEILRHTDAIVLAVPPHSRAAGQRAN